MKTAEGAFSCLYKENIKKIYNFIYYKTHHKETAEDLASLTFLKAWQNIDSYSMEKGSAAAWLYAIARNTVIDFYRSQKPNVNVYDVWDLPDSHDLRIDIETKLKIDEIKKYLKKFSVEQRDIIIMRVWQELPYKEIADIVGKSEASCKMIFSRALSQMKKEAPAIMLALIILNGLI